MGSKVFLTLSDGSVFQGFGKISGPLEGELVISPDSGGYTQVLTDPSSFGQIVVFTFPPLGICGVDSESAESRRIWAKAAAADCPEDTENGRFEQFSSWMSENGCPLIYGIDTRSLLLRLRRLKKSVCRIDFEAHTPSESPAAEIAPKDISCREITAYGTDGTHIAVVDYGIRESIVRALTDRGCRVTRFPFDAPADVILHSGAQGLILGGGLPPAGTEGQLGGLLCLMQHFHTMGIGLGNLLIARAFGAAAEKMPHCHIGSGLPVLEISSGLGMITEQNHIFSVTQKSLEYTELCASYVNLADGTVEGLRHKHRDISSVQFYPEINPDNGGTSCIYDRFLTRVRAAGEER